MGAEGWGRQPALKQEAFPNELLLFLARVLKTRNLLVKKLNNYILIFLSNLHKLKELKVCTAYLFKIGILLQTRSLDHIRCVNSLPLATLTPCFGICCQVRVYSYKSAETFLKGWRVKTEPFRLCVLLQGVDHLNLRYWIKETSVRLPGFKWPLFALLKGDYTALWRIKPVWAFGWDALCAFCCKQQYYFFFFSHSLPGKWWGKCELILENDKQSCPSIMSCRAWLNYKRSD